jgi:hypothetical protein
MMICMNVSLRSSCPTNEHDFGYPVLCPKYIYPSRSVIRRLTVERVTSKLKVPLIKIQKLYTIIIS